MCNSHFQHSLPRIMSSLCFPQHNRALKVVKDFRLALRRAQHAAIFECFRTFNRKGGAVVPLQSGEYMYFARACILAIYADQPAARKCSLTGSACPVCFTPETSMSKSVQEERHSVLRTDANMARRKRILTAMAGVKKPGAKTRAHKKARRMGVNLEVDNAWSDRDAKVHEKVLGTCPNRDNVHQNLPQPNLHGWDEGLVCKANSGALEATIKEAHQRDSKCNATTVRSCRTLVPFDTVINVFSVNYNSVINTENVNYNYCN